MFQAGESGSHPFWVGWIPIVSTILKGIALTEEEQKYFDNSDNWLNHIINEYDAKIICVENISYEVRYPGPHEPKKRSRYFELNDKILEIGPCGDIQGEITDGKLLFIFRCAKMRV